MKNYKELLENQDKRMNPDNITMQKAIFDELQKTPQNYVAQYIKQAMFGVDEHYTQRTIEAGNKVKDNLKSKLSDVSFEFQGSVMTNTHIRGYSDIDLLTITEKFYTFDRSGIQNILQQADIYFRYTVNQINSLSNVLNSGGYTKGMGDLRKLRLDTENILMNIYKYVNISKPKSIEVELTQPKRKVDVVIAGWYNDANYYLENNKTLKAIKVFYKGISQIYDRELKPDYPFLRIKLLNEKDSEVFGRLKRMIRFLKTLKYDADEDRKIELSSFDINAICYDIETFKYSSKTYLELVPVIYDQLKRIAENYTYRYNLKSIDGKEFIFRKENQITEDSEKTNFVKLLINEIDALYSELRNIRLIA